MLYFQSLPDEEVRLTAIENMYAASEADRLIKRHGYWMALYHSMTLLVWCRKPFIVHWTEQELKDIKYWWTVRNYIYRSK